MATTKNKTFTYKERGKNYLMEVEFGIQFKGTDNEYFTVTGYVMEQVNSRSGVSESGEEYKLVDGKYYAEFMGGCIHDEIKKVTNEFNDFIPMHLARLNGMPMHAFANGFYHLKNGFNDTPASSEDFKVRFSDYYRIPYDVFDKLIDTNSQEDYAVVLMNNGVIDKWMDDAKKVIEKYQL
jgi:hypothetical protein